MSEDVIDKLVKLHGEGGLAPTRKDWQVIFAIEDAVPILNLLQFHFQVKCDEGMITGAEAYERYGQEAGPAFMRCGGKRIFFGNVEHIFGSEEGKGWDAAILTSYPSAAALANMWLDPVFIHAHSNRLDALKKSQVLIFNGNN